MMSEEFSVFKKFKSVEQAEELKEQLLSVSIESIIADNAPPVDITFSGSTVNIDVEIRLKPSDFPKAEAFLKKNAENLLDEIDKDHYLFEFSDDELFDILKRPDEWSEMDYSLAQKLLKERGRKIDDDFVENLRKERMSLLSQPEGSQKSWIVAGYIFAFMIGFIGIIIGYFLWTSKKTIPGGKKIYSYSPNDRKQGMFIFYIGLIVFIANVIYQTLPYIY